VCLVGTVCAAIVLSILRLLAPVVADRALSSGAVVLLGFANLGWLILQSLGGYLRAWRKEPLMEVVLIGVAAVVFGTALAAQRTSTMGTLLTHSLLVVFGLLPTAIVAFRRERLQTG